MYQSVLELSEPFDIFENMPMRCGRQTTGANHPANMPKQYWKVSLLLAFIDHMIRELRVKSRLVLSENHFFALYLLHRVVGNKTNQQILTLSETYETNLTCNFDESIERSLDAEHVHWFITSRECCYGDLLVYYVC